MCHTPDNSLKASLAAQAEMLRQGNVTLDRMPKLRADAENAERIYQTLMESAGWTPEELFQHTAYHLSTVVSPINN